MSERVVGSPDHEIPMPSIVAFTPNEIHHFEPEPGVLVLPRGIFRGQSSTASKSRRVYGQVVWRPVSSPSVEHCIITLINLEH